MAEVLVCGAWGWALQELPVLPAWDGCMATSTSWRRQWMRDSGFYIFSWDSFTWFLLVFFVSFLLGTMYSKDVLSLSSYSLHFLLIILRGFFSPLCSFKKANLTSVDQKAAHTIFSARDLGKMRTRTVGVCQEMHAVLFKYYLIMCSCR